MFLGVVLLFFVLFLIIMRLHYIDVYNMFFKFINAFNFRIAVMQFLILQGFLSLSSDGTQGLIHRGTLRNHVSRGPFPGTLLIGVRFQEPCLSEFSSSNHT